MTAYTQGIIDSLTTLNRIAETLNGPTQITVALRSALADLVALMGLQSGWIFLRDPMSKNQWFGSGFTLAADYHLPPALALNRAMAWKGGCDCQALCTGGELKNGVNEVRCSRLSALSREERGGLAVHASAPLQSGSETLGILNVAAADWSEFTPEALALLTNVGSLMGIAVERARLYDLLEERRIAEQAALLEFSNALLSRLQPNKLQDYMVREVRRLLHVDAAALLTPDFDGRRLVFRAAVGWRHNPATLGVRLPENEFNPAAQAVALQQPFLAEDIEPHVQPLFDLDWLQGEGFRGYAVMPLLVESRASGVLWLNTRQPRRFSDDELRFLHLMASQVAVAVEGIRLLEEEAQHQRLEEELSLGRQIQLSLLPRTGPELPGWEIAAQYKAARMVGGDFYDFFDLPGAARRVGMVIGDVTDKGVAAALFMVLSRTVIRTAALSGRGAAAALLRANELILNDSQSDLFLSAFYAILEPHTGRLWYANAGHNRPLWYRAGSSTVQELWARGIVLGAFADIALEEGHTVIEPGDVVLFYTDGLSEALNNSEEMLGLPHITAVLAQHAHERAPAIAAALFTAYQEFIGLTEQSDDVTFFVLKREEAASSAAQVAK